MKSETTAVQNMIPYFSVDESFQAVYRNSSTSTPVVPHTHNALELYFTLTDLPDVLLNDTVISVPKGTLILIPPYCVHQLFNQKLTIYERYILSINTLWLEQVFSGHPALVRFASFSAKPQLIPLAAFEQEQFIQMLQPLLGDTVPSMQSYADFFALLAQVETFLQKFSDDGHPSGYSISPSQKNVNHIISYINENLTGELSLRGIAEHFYMNKDYLARLFKEHTHSTVGHYISLQRVRMAQKLLAEGMTVTEVQEYMGFSSYAYFFKFFQKMTGISPSQYRKNI